MGAYLGHFADLPNDQFLAFGSNYQDALDGIDKIGQADESSVRPVEHRLLMRVTLTRADDLFFFHIKDDPFVEVTHDLVHLRDNPGTGATGDTMRSYGPLCRKCGAKHFPQQDCRAFTEFSDRLQAGLFLSTTTPGEGVIEIFENSPETPRRFPEMVYVADLDELGAFGLFPFVLKDDHYREDGTCDVDVDGETLLEACEEAGVEVPFDPVVMEEE